MKFVHAAVLVSSGDNADRFYGELLGLDLLREYEVGRELMDMLFGIEKEFPVRLYGEGDVQFEVFMASDDVPSPFIAHTCIQVIPDDRPLPPLIQLPVFIQGQGHGRDDNSLMKGIQDFCG